MERLDATGPAEIYFKELLRGAFATFWLILIEHALSKVVSGNADEDPRLRTFQAARGIPCIFQRLPAHFQQQSLLRIHADRFAAGDSKKCGIEAVRVLEHAASRDILSAES